MKTPESPDTKKKPNLKVPSRFTKIWTRFYLIILLIFLISWVFSSKYQPSEITWFEFKTSMLEAGEVEMIEIINREVVNVYIKKEYLTNDKHEDIAKNPLSNDLNPGPHYTFNIGSIEVFEENLSKVQSDMEEEQWPEVRFDSKVNWLQGIWMWLLPIALIILFWNLMLRRSGMRGRNLINFGSSTASMFDATKTIKVTFQDVAGLKEAKTEVKEIVEFLKKPENYTRLGGKIPKGVILVGPPGTGKTLLAKAVAGEAKVPFFSLSGSEFVEMFVGVGASRVRDLFKKAKEKAPSIVFIDEIDAIGRSRGKVQSIQANDERENTLNQLLTELDGFEPNTGVIVLAATNRADILDHALLRPGRFDRHIYLELPNLVERKEIFQVHLRPLKLDPLLDIDRLAAQTPGFSGADIANICNEAALIAARHQKAQIEQEDFGEATDRIVAGLEKKSKILSAEEKTRVAYHEAGHATVSWLLPHTDALLKVSIVPRGKSLGAAWYLPEEHQIITKSEFHDKLCAALGGRAAEEIIFGEVSSGALDDLEKVTKQAYTMVAYYGLNDKVGNLSYYDSSGEQGRLLQKPYSEATAELIDQEVRNLVGGAYQETQQLLLKNLPKLKELANLLLAKEVIHRHELERVLGKRTSTSQSIVSHNSGIKNSSTDHIVNSSLDL